MAKKKNVVRKRKINKFKLLIVVLAILVIISSLAFGLRLIIKPKESNKKIDPGQVDSINKENESIEHLDLDKSKVSNKKIKILIDAGHGGNDVGAQGANGSLEKNISLEVAKKVAGYLSQYKDLELILSRTEDTYVSLEERTKIANEQGANIVVSIHLNSQTKGRDAFGTETYYQKNDNYDSENLAKCIQDTVCMYLDTRNRGVYESNLEVLRDTSMTSALVEIGFISNKKEEEKLNSQSYQNKMAEGIAQGVLSYIDSKYK